MRLMALILLCIGGPAAEPRATLVAGTAIRIPLAAEWRSDATVPGASVVLRGPSSAPVAHQVSVAVVRASPRPGEDDAAFFTRCVSDLGDFAAGFRTGPANGTGQSLRTVAGTTWRVLDYSIRFGQVVHHQRLHAALDRDQAWLVTAGAADPARIEAAGPVVEAVLAALGGSQPLIR
jgi:hypothetical protein